VNNKTQEACRQPAWFRLQSSTTKNNRTSRTKQHDFKKDANSTAKKNTVPSNEIQHTIKRDVEHKYRCRMELQHRHGRVVEELRPLRVAGFLGQEHVENALWRALGGGHLCLDAPQGVRHPLTEERALLQSVQSPIQSRGRYHLHYPVNL
jgi:hypothetical protein